MPSYTGPSSYLLFCKYNDYAFQDGSGVNRVALLDPNATQIDPHPSANGLVEMREVLTVSGPTPDPEYLSGTFLNARREWCINTAVIDPFTKSILANSDGPFADLFKQFVANPPAKADTKAKLTGTQP